MQVTAVLDLGWQAEGRKRASLLVSALVDRLPGQPQLQRSRDNAIVNRDRLMLYKHSRMQFMHEFDNHISGGGTAPASWLEKDIRSFLRP
jgi:hypothetical protein